MRSKTSSFLLLTLAVIVAPIAASAQGTAADYDRALGLRKKFEALVDTLPEGAHWIGKTDRFWYRRAVKGGHDFILVDAVSQAKGPAFDHAKLGTQSKKQTDRSFSAPPASPREILRRVSA